MNNMTRRNGNAIKIVAVSAALLSAVYFVYVLNNTNGKLKETERIAERYRREQESLQTQLQELSAAKDDMQQRSENEKKEFINRLNTLNQHHKMLKSQHDDLQADYSRLQAERDKEREDTKLQDAQRNQEYMQFKQEKELEISSLRDQLANFGRDKQELTDQITRMAGQLKDSQKQRATEQNERTILEQQIRDMKKEMNVEHVERATQARQLGEVKQRLLLEQVAKQTLQKENGELKQTNLQYEGNSQFLRQQLQASQDKFYSEQTVIGALEQQLKNLLQEKDQLKQQNLQLVQAQQAAAQSQQAAAQPQQVIGNLQQPQQPDQLHGNQPLVHQAHQNLHFQPLGNQGLPVGQNPLVGANQVQGADNPAVNQGLNQGIQHMQQDNAEKKIPDILMEQQQQQHQVQAPNLNGDQNKKLYGGGSDKQTVEFPLKRGQTNLHANAILDAEQQGHQMVPPDDHINVVKVVIPDSNMAGEVDKNANDVNRKMGGHDSNHAEEIDHDVNGNGDHHVGPAPPGNDNVQAPNVMDNQLNIPPPNENVHEQRLDQDHQGNDNAVLDEEGKHQLAPPGEDLNVDVKDKPDSNMAVEVDKNINEQERNVKIGGHDSNQAAEMDPGANGQGDHHVLPANDNLLAPNMADNQQLNVPPPNENDQFGGHDNWNGVNPLVDDQFQQKVQENGVEEEKKALDETDNNGDDKEEEYEDDYDANHVDKEDEPKNRQIQNPPDPFVNNHAKR